MILVSGGSQLTAIRPASMETMFLYGDDCDVTLVPGGNLNIPYEMGIPHGVHLKWEDGWEVVPANYIGELEYCVELADGRITIGDDYHVLDTFDWQMECLKKRIEGE